MKRGSHQGGTHSPGSVPIRIVAFLGNPGREYVRTRHNVGWMVCDTLSARLGTDSWKEKFGARIAPAGAVVLVCPAGYMNRSGAPVQQALRFYSADAASLLVVHDDLETDFGVVAAAWNGGDRGHNGLRSISQHLGTREYWRLRVGIGRPPGRRDPARWVLERFDRDQEERLDEVLELAAGLTERSLANPVVTSDHIRQS